MGSEWTRCWTSSSGARAARGWTRRLHVRKEARDERLHLLQDRRGQDPEPQGLRGRRHARLPRHQPAGAGALHDHPQAPHRLARRLRAVRRPGAGAHVRARRAARARAGGHGRLPHHREHRPGRQAGRVSFAYTYPRRRRASSAHDRARQGLGKAAPAPERQMGSFSIWHWLIVLVIVLLIFGTKKLRNMGSDLGGAVKGFKDGVKGDEVKKPGEISSTGSTIEGEVKEKQKG